MEEYTLWSVLENHDRTAALLLVGLSLEELQRFPCQNSPRIQRLVFRDRFDASNWLVSVSAPDSYNSLSLSLASRAWQEISCPEGKSVDFGIIVLKSKTSSEFNMVLHSADWTVLAQGPSDQALMNQSLAASLLDSLILGSRQGFGSPKLKLQCAFPPDELRKLVTGDCSLVHWESGPIEEPAWTQKARAIFSGSFNPLHSGHRKLADAAAQWLSLPVVFEIPIQNADKPPLDYLSLKHRLAQFSDRAVILSKAPTFREKAELLPDSVFVIGMDTAERIFQSKFYGDPLQGVPDALSIIAACRCRFLVAGRIQEGEFRTLQDLDVPVEFRHLFSELPPDLFREDISSSVIRERNPQWGEFF